MCFGFIYDIAIIIKAQIGTFIHPLFYFIICLAYAILSFFDYIFNEKFTYLVLEDMKVIVHSNNQEEVQDMKNSAQSENRESHKNDENDKRENNKSKNE